MSLFLVGSWAQSTLGSELKIKMQKNNRIMNILNWILQVIQGALSFNIIDGMRVILSAKNQFFGFSASEDGNVNI